VIRLARRYGLNPRQLRLAMKQHMSAQVRREWGGYDVSKMVRR
jgi:hypothetical protein